MALKLYIYHGSPPCRAVLVTSKALGINLDIHAFAHDTDELQRPEFLKINPQRKVPALIDDGKIICDSHAINVYLVSKYGKDDSLYPKDPYRRALVDEKLYFDAGTMFPYLVELLPQFMNKQIKFVPTQKADSIRKSYEVLERFLENHQWVAGDKVTLADFSLVATVRTLDVLVKVEAQKFPKITAWIKRAQALPWYVTDDKEQEEFVTWFKSIL